jgi:hypothetical protein
MQEIVILERRELISHVSPTMGMCSHGAMCRVNSESFRELRRVNQTN